jgi:hypothetical protein
MGSPEASPARWAWTSVDAALPMNPGHGHCPARRRVARLISAPIRRRTALQEAVADGLGTGVVGRFGGIEHDRRSFAAPPRKFARQLTLVTYPRTGRSAPVVGGWLRLALVWYQRGISRAISRSIRADSRKSRRCGWSGGWHCGASRFSGDAASIGRLPMAPTGVERILRRSVGMSLVGLPISCCT